MLIDRHFDFVIIFKYLPYLNNLILPFEFKLNQY